MIAKPSYFSIFIFFAIALLTIKKVDANLIAAKRQLDPNFGQSLQSSIEAQNSAIQSSIETMNAGIQSSISQQGQSLSTSLSNLFQSITISHSTAPFTQPSNGVCNGNLVNGQCCNGPIVNNVCYSPNADKSGASGGQSTPAPTASGASGSSSGSSGSTSGNNAGNRAEWCAGLLTVNLFAITFFLWL